MPGEFFFTTAEIAQQLGVGVSTVKFWIKRYSAWLLTDTIGDDGAYSEEALDKFQIIAECTASGMDISTIETILANRVENQSEEIILDTPDNNKNDDSTASPIEETVEKASTSIFDNLNTNGIDTILLQILEQQKKIATAQERRATAEERKAFALESRTEAELLKANVMQEMLSVFKSNSNQPTVGSLMEKIHQMPGPGPSELESLNYDFADSFEDLPELTESVSGQTETPAPADLKNVEAPVEKSENEIENAEPEPNQTIGSETETQKKADVEAVTTQDLKPPTQIPLDMDDLSLLIDSTEVSHVDDTDDLSALIDDAVEAQPDADMDDLSLLIDVIPEQTADDTSDMDDLSLLIEDINVQPDNDMDDLSLLLEDVSVQVDDDMDDLSLLIEITEEEIPAEKSEPAVPDVAPAPTEQKTEPAEVPASSDHKSMVLSKIIKMKEKEGLSIDETTKKLNDEGIKTLSGKGQWDSKTIAGIYKYIDSGKGKK